MSFRFVPLALAALVSAAAVSAPAAAAEFRNFDAATFATAQKAGRAIVVDVHATWCPTCAAQSRAISRIVTDRKFDKLLVLNVDYDTQKPVWQGFKAQKQGVLIAFHGTQERARLAFLTDDANITKLLGDAL